MLEPSIRSTFDCPQSSDLRCRNEFAFFYLFLIARFKRLYTSKYIYFFHLLCRSLKRFPRSTIFIVLWKWMHYMLVLERLQSVEQAIELRSAFLECMFKSIRKTLSFGINESYLHAMR